MVIWTPRARADLKAIHDHIAKDSPLLAKKIVRELGQKPSILPECPQMGRKVPETDDADLREISLHSWRIIYLLRHGRIFILTLIHKRRQLDANTLTPH